MEPEPIIPSTGAGDTWTVSRSESDSFKVKYKVQDFTVEERPNGVTIMTARLQLGGRPLKVTLNYKSNFSPADAKNDMEHALVQAVGLAKILQIGTATQKVTVKTDQKMVVTKRTGTEEFESVETGLQKEIETAEAKIKQEENPQTQFNAAARISKIQRFIEAPPVVKKETVQPLAGFATQVSKAKHLANEIEKQEKHKLSFLLNRYQELYAKINEASPEEILSLRRDLQRYSFELKEAFNTAENELFDQLQEKLVAITNEYNALLDKKLNTPEGHPDHDYIDPILEHLESSIQRCNEIVGQTNLTTNPLTIAKSHVMDFGAVVEKKLALREKLFIGQGDASKDSKRAEGGKYDKQLSKAPSIEDMNIVAELMQAFFKGDKKSLMTTGDAKSMYGQFPELKWGKSHLNIALQTAANWTNIRSIVVKKSSSGRLYPSVSINEPLLITAESGGMPAGLLKVKKFQTRPLNLFKTTSYILGANKEHIGKVVSFRGGQFASVESAKKAILEIQKNLPEGVALTELHVNSLLTPFYFTSLKSDRTLLQAHRDNLVQAFKELRIEIPLTLSNFGVNEGAIGKMKVAGVTLPTKLGWHTAIAEYDNPAVEQLNKSLKAKFDTLAEQVDYSTPDNLALLDRLGAIGEIGLEMEAIWAKNDYADPHVGNNQFKMPSLWKTMDALLGIPCYTNCMSGKDRTGKVESNAQENLDEIFMNIADQKRLLAATFDDQSRSLSDWPDKQEEWNKFRAELTSACFTEADIRLLNRSCQSKPVEEMSRLILTFIQTKVNTMQRDLGVAEGGNGLFEKKEGVPRGFFNIGVRGIPTNESKWENTIDNLNTPRVAPRSVYEKLVQDKGLDQQRQAKNRRINQMTASLRITQVNTGKPGYKIEGGEPLARFSSGFDRNYIERLLEEQSVTRVKVFEALGLHELPIEVGNRYLSQIMDTRTIADPKKKKTALLYVLRQIEHDKMKSLAPQVKVAA